MPKKVLAVSAHPDDIEFMMAGTLILLKQAGCEIHYLTIANGSCGTNRHDRETIIAMRRRESMAAADSIGAVFHESLVNDIEIFYDAPLLRRVSSTVREVVPDIILTHGLDEYMEDHRNTCRLVVTAAFTRGMPNFDVSPPCAPVDNEITLYHALPYGLRDCLGRTLVPAMYTDITPVLRMKREMLAKHASQKEWLDISQGLDSYLLTMENMSRTVGRMSERFEYAEGWTRHLALGLCREDADPLSAILGKAKVEPATGLEPVTA